MVLARDEHEAEVRCGGCCVAASKGVAEQLPTARVVGAARRRGGARDGRHGGAGVSAAPPG
eukprot:5386395-Lingulodinium_polyedra.AAC.1